MVELAKEQEGFLGIESAREEIGITVEIIHKNNSTKLLLMCL
jgi:DNA helicase TIP49 (TBP-interacting protein)